MSKMNIRTSISHIVNAILYQVTTSLWARPWRTVYWFATPYCPWKVKRG